MSTKPLTPEQTQLHHWIDQLPPYQLKLIYQLVEELIGDQHDDTDYLLRSAKMRKRLLAARKSSEAISIEAAREKLGI